MITELLQAILLEIRGLRADLAREDIQVSADAGAKVDLANLGHLVDSGPMIRVADIPMGARPLPMTDMRGLPVFDQQDAPRAKKPERPIPNLPDRWMVVK